MLKNKKGIALIMSVGILAIMSIIATSFAINMRMEQEAALNYLRSVKAKYAAEAGINKVIADIRNKVKTASYDVVIATSYSTTDDQTIENLGSYTLTYAVTVSREDEKVNLNALDDTDSIWIDRLKSAGLSYDDIAKIIDYRDLDSDITTGLYTSSGWINCNGNEDEKAKNSLFATIEEIKLIEGITQTKFEAIKNLVTVYGPIIRGGLLAEYYDNYTGGQIDKSSFKGKVIELGELCEYHWEGDHLRANNENPEQHNMPGSDGEWAGWLETHDAEWSGFYLLSGVGDYGIGTFGVILEGFIEILPDEVDSPVTFYLRVDDGGRLYIDGTKIIDEWHDQGMDPGLDNASTNYTFTYAGWHPIRIEYYENWGANGLELKWSLEGSSTPEGSGRYVPPERLGFYPLVSHPLESNMAYNSSGIYKIVSLGKTETSDDKILAEKKISGIFKIFGTWTQTTKEEFHAAWFNDYDNYADGEVRNVTWLNSCPTPQAEQATIPNSVKLGYWDDFDEDLAYSTIMLEGTWNVYIDGGSGWNSLPWVSHAWSGATYGEEIIPGDSTSRVTNFSDFDGDGDNEFRIRSRGGYDTPYEPWKLNAQNKHAEINGKYYYSDATIGYDIFTEGWIKESPNGPSGRKSWEGNGTVASNAKYNSTKTSYTYGYWYDDVDGDDQWDWNDSNLNGQYDPGVDEAETWPLYTVRDNSNNKIYIYNPSAAPGSGQYWQAEPPFIVGWFQPRVTSGATVGYHPIQQEAVPFAYIEIKDEDMHTYTDADKCEMVLSGDFDTVNQDYLIEKRLCLIGKGLDNKAFVNGIARNSGTDDNFTHTVGLLNNNLYSLVEWGWVASSTNYGIVNNKPPSPYPYSAPPYMWASDAVNLHGSNTDLDVFFDDIRVIQNSGFLISTPVYVGGSQSYSSNDITWGSISWTEDIPSNTSITIEVRTADSKSALSETDSGWSSSLTNGSQINLSGDWLQYKVSLLTDAININDYTGSQVTPVFKDITITYLPNVELLYWREETE